MFVGGPNIRKDYHIEEGEEVGLQTAPPLTPPWEQRLPPIAPEPVDRDGVVRWLMGEGHSTEITG